MYAGVPISAPVRVSADGGRAREVSVVAGHQLDRRVFADLRAVAGQAEVDDPDGAVVRDHDVLGLEVAVDDAGGVRGRQAPAGGEEDRANLRPGAGLAAQPRRQRLTFDELHRDEDAVVDRADVVDHDDVGVREARDRLGLLQHAPAAARR